MNKSLLAFLTEQAKKNPKRFALPECDAIDTLQAARIVLANGKGIPVLVNDPEVIKATAEKAHISLDGMEIIDSTNQEAKDALIKRFLGLESRDITFSDLKYLVDNPLYYAMLIVAVGDADCLFCGHKTTLRDVLTSSQMTIGLKDGVESASTIALIEVPGYNGPEGEYMIFADGSTDSNPTPAKLATAAITAADEAKKLMGWEPRVAFLSSSTDGSAGNDYMIRVTQAINIVKQSRPDIKVDGEFQLDAAIIPKVATAKVKRPSEVAGVANVLIFPDANSINIGLKLVSIFAKNSRFWLMISGLKKPVANGTRAATIQEMVGDIAMIIVAAGK